MNCYTCAVVIRGIDAEETNLCVHKDCRHKIFDDTNIAEMVCLMRERKKQVEQ